VCCKVKNRSSIFNFLVAYEQEGTPACSIGFVFLQGNAFLNAQSSPAFSPRRYRASNSLDR
jgi:hypothetical protein